MKTGNEYSDGEAEFSVDESARAAERELTERLVRERPYPRAAFRAMLQGPEASEHASSPAYAYPRRLWVRVSALALSGGGLLSLAAVAVASHAPLVG